MRVYTGHYTLCRRFLISCSSVHLPCKVEIFDRFQLQRRPELGGIEIVVFHGVGRTVYLYILKSLDSVQRVDLDIERERRRKALEIIFVGIPPFWLKKELVGIVLRKNLELVFYARTISRPLAMDESVEKRRLGKPGTQYLVHPLVGMEYEAGHLSSCFLY